MAAGGRQQAGVTLVEICIAIVILALAAMIVVPAVGNLTRADLRSAANGVASTVRYCYDQAAISGQTYRLTLTAGGRRLQIDATDAAVALGSLGESVQAKGFIGGLEQAATVGSSDGGYSPVKSYDLPASVQIFDVWTDETTVAQKHASVSLLFFPDGYTQDAIVHLQDSAERMMSVKVAALTGRCGIEPGYLEAAR
jgi:type II secretory pathway pseudopilin PulG